jgi:hypothetical protein|nr:hypothetical protein [Kofleriaceae bacterium]
MKRALWAISLASASAACSHAATMPATTLSLRPACADTQFFDPPSGACKPRGSAAAQIDAGATALAAFDVDTARKSLDAAEIAGPLTHTENVRLWEQRGIAAAYVDDEPTARAAFDMMLALDPGHFLSYRLSPKATFVFDDMRAAHRVAPSIELDLPRGQKVGDPLPIDLAVVADPKAFLKRGTLFVRTRGDATWRAADLALVAGTDRRVELPPVIATKPTSVELYLRAYDDKGNEVLAYADPEHPREIPLRYEPPTPFYKKWWVITIAAGVVATATGLIVYEATLAPPDKVNGGVTQ